MGFRFGGGWGGEEKGEKRRRGKGGEGKIGIKIKVVRGGEESM